MLTTPIANMLSFGPIWYEGHPGESDMGREPQDFDEKYSEQEAQQRFEKLVRSALNTKPKPLKSMGPKGVPAQSKKRQKSLREGQSKGQQK